MGTFQCCYTQLVIENPLLQIIISTRFCCCSNASTHAMNRCLQDSNSLYFTWYRLGVSRNHGINFSSAPSSMWNARIISCARQRRIACCENKFMLLGSAKRKEGVRAHTFPLIGHKRKGRRATTWCLLAADHFRHRIHLFSAFPRRRDIFSHPNGACDAINLARRDTRKPSLQTAWPEGLWKDHYTERDILSFHLVTLTLNWFEADPWEQDAIDVTQF